jgi:allantoate deiminase
MGTSADLAREAIRRCRLLAACTEHPGHITRTFLSVPMHEAHHLVRSWMEGAGLEVRVDAVGNLRGIYGSGPRLLVGSHLDTVPDAGAFDGILGVMIGIALVERHPACALEIVGFSDEEGVRFGIPFLGSLAMAGSPVMDAPVLDAIRAFGLDPAQIPGAAIPGDVRGFLEFHIEQGPILAGLKRHVGVVEAIVGQSRAVARFTGKANHAGATPMDARRDALTAAAEWIGAVEALARGTRGLVATVGRVDVEPGAFNVIPGAVRASLDVRHARDAVRIEAVKQLRAQAQSIAQARHIGCDWRAVCDETATPMNHAMVEALGAAMRAAGHPDHRMISGAGHDAMILARKVPTAMLFMRTPNGVSHHPDETVLVEDVEAALEVGIKFLESWRPS